MSKSRDRVLQALNHQNTDYVPVDFGSTAVTGIHCRIVANRVFGAGNIVIDCARDTHWSLNL